MKVAKLLDAKRSQAVGIFISSLHLQPSDIETGVSSLIICYIINFRRNRVSNTPGNPGNILELFFLLEFAKSPGNFLAEFVC